MGDQVPGVTLSARGAARARSGHPWIFRADVQSAPPDLASGAEVRLADARGNFVAKAFWAERSPIALRILSRRDEPLDDAFLRARIERSVARRRRLFPGADAYRAVHGEADLLPGYFADLYGDLLAVQHLSLIHI